MNGINLISFNVFVIVGRVKVDVSMRIAGKSQLGGAQELTHCQGSGALASLTDSAAALVGAIAPTAAGPPPAHSFPAASCSSIPLASLDLSATEARSTAPSLITPEAGAVLSGAAMSTAAARGYPRNAASAGPRSVGRIAVQSLGGPGWGPLGGDSTAAGLLKAVYRLRALVRNRRCAVMLTVPAGAEPCASVMDAGTVVVSLSMLL